MDWSFLFKENEFVSYTAYHYIPIALIFCLGIIVTFLGLKLKSQRSKTLLGVALSLIPFLSYISSFILSYYEGFDYKEDLPFHLCRFLCLIAPFVMYYRNRFWLGILYFWVIVGTLNANITPDITFGFPHWNYFIYWLMHTGLLILPLYAIFVFNIKIKWRDYLNAYIGVNCFVVFTLIINFLLESNYMYTLKKPAVATILDMLGPWPWYLVSGQVLALGLCFIAYLPFFLYYRIVK